VPEKHAKQNAVLKKHFSAIDRFGLRLTKIFCAVGDVLQDDLKRHPWKLIALFTPFPLDLTLVIAGTLAYFALGLTKRGREGRKKIVRSAVDPIDYFGFKHFFTTKIRKSRKRVFNLAAAPQPAAVKPSMPEMPEMSPMPENVVDMPVSPQPIKMGKDALKDAMVHDGAGVAVSAFSSASPVSVSAASSVTANAQTTSPLVHAFARPRLTSHVVETRHKKLSIHWPRVRKTLYWNGKVSALTTVHDWLSSLPDGKFSRYFSKKAERQMISARAAYPTEIVHRRSFCKNPAL